MNGVHVGDPDFELPPADLPLQMDVAGSAFLGRDIFALGATPSDFHDPVLRDIIEACLALRRRGEDPTPKTVAALLPGVRVEGFKSVDIFIVHMMSQHACASNLREKIAALKRHSATRELILMARDWGKAAQRAPLDFPIEEQLEEVMARARSLKSTIPSAKDDAELVFLDEIEEEPDRLDVIDGMISAASVGAVYGEWSVGKTFFSIYAMFCIALGHQCLGRDVDRGAVLYVPYEGIGRIGRRLKAAKAEYGDPGYAFSYLRKPGSIQTQAAADLFVQQLLKAAARLVVRSGLPLRLVVIDTLSAGMAGKNENDADGMAIALGAGESIARETGASVVYVAHPGKDKTKGLRGNYALPAGLTDLIRIEKPDKDDDTRTIYQEKCRDGVQGERGTYKLRTVVLGQDPRGKDITTCVVDLDAADRGKPRKPDLPKPNSQAGKALNELNHLIIAGRFKVSRGHPRIPDGARVVSKSDWREACRKKGLTGTGNADAEKKAFQRADGDISARGIVGDYEDGVWMVGHGHLEKAPAQNN